MNQPVSCHECSADAVGRCRSCGKGFCGGHGADLCRGCATAIVAIEPSKGPIVKQAYLQCVSRPRMPTVYLDDDGPPECYCCQSYARYVCQSCHNLYCPSHAGKNQCCDNCAREAAKSAGVAGVVLGLLFALLVLVVVLNWLQVW